MTAATDRWASLPGPRKLLRAARSLLEERRSGPGVTVRAELTAAERAQVGRVLGLDWEVSGRPVTLGRLRAALGRAGDDLLDLLTRTGGPVEDLRARREEDAAAVESAYAALTAAGVPAHAVALARARRWLDGPDPALELARLWKVLPLSARLPLAELAHDLFGDPHRLDRDTPLGRLAARLLAAVTAGPADATAAARAADAALGAVRWRQVWAGYGVSCDEVSATVLVLNLPLAGVPLSTACPGEPVWLTGRSLRGSWSPACSGVVRVCGNPAVAEAAADRLGASCRPLVCVYGRPSSAAWALLRGLAGAGVRLLVTADRDDAGRQILADLLALPGAGEWLPEAPGLYEEARVEAMLADLATRARMNTVHPGRPAVDVLDQVKGDSRGAGTRADTPPL